MSYQNQQYSHSHVTLVSELGRWIGNEFRLAHLFMDRLERLQNGKEEAETNQEDIRPAISIGQGKIEAALV
jgi:hypothetical protein